MKGFYIYTLKMPVEAIQRARAAVAAAAAVYDAADAEIAGLPSDIVKDGSRAIAAANARRAELRTQMDAATQNAKREVAAAREEYFNALRLASVPTTEQLDAVRAEIELLDRNLINGESELAEFAERVKDNPAARAAIRNYAKQNGLRGFDFLSRETSLNEFGNEFFNEAELAAAAPGGRSYYGMVVGNAENVRSMVRENGLQDEFDASCGGQTISDAGENA